MACFLVRQDFYFYHRVQICDSPLDHDTEIFGGAQICVIAVDSSLTFSLSAEQIWSITIEKGSYIFGSRSGHSRGLKLWCSALLQSLVWFNRTLTHHIWLSRSPFCSSHPFSFNTSPLFFIFLFTKVELEKPIIFHDWELQKSQEATCW